MIWLPTPSHPAYEVSSLGAVRRVGAERELVARPCHNSYLRVRLWRNGRKHECRVHLLCSRLSMVLALPRGITAPTGSRVSTTTR